MSASLYCKNYPVPAVNKKEALRFAFCSQADAEVELLFDSCMREMAPCLSCKVCYAEFPVNLKGNLIDLGFTCVESADLAKNLAGCERIVLFAATVGAGVDRLIAKYSRVSPAKAHMLQALGSERVESLCDVFCEEIAKNAAERGFSVRPRFSPGYGDLELALQTQIFQTLDIKRNLGVSLNESLLMFPSKSVTAIVGLKKI